MGEWQNPTSLRQLFLCPFLVATRSNYGGAAVHRWRYAQSKGYHLSLAQQLFSAAGPVLAAEGVYESLAACEQWNATVCGELSAQPFRRLKTV